jgi:hypothetical protein
VVLVESILGWIGLRHPDWYIRKKQAWEFRASFTLSPKHLEIDLINR